jgi:hypothetical protein
MIEISEIEKVIAELDELSTKLSTDKSDNQYSAMYLLGTQHKAENVSKRLKELLPK